MIPCEPSSHHRSPRNGHPVSLRDASRQFQTLCKRGSQRYTDHCRLLHHTGDRKIFMGYVLPFQCQSYIIHGPDIGNDTPHIQRDACRRDYLLCHLGNDHLFVSRRIKTLHFMDRNRCILFPDRPLQRSDLLLIAALESNRTLLRPDRLFDCCGSRYNLCGMMDHQIPVGPQKRFALRSI